MQVKKDKETIISDLLKKVSDKEDKISNLQNYLTAIVITIIATLLLFWRKA